MSASSCKIIICSEQLAALVRSAAMNAPMVGMDVQQLLNAQMSATEQQKLIDDINKGIAAFQAINNAILA